MPTLVILTILAIAFYIFYKIKFWRMKRPYERRWVNAKASIALGLFLFLFGLNRLFIDQTTVVFIVCAIFLAVGALYTYNGFKAYRHFRPLAAEEATQKND